MQYKPKFTVVIGLGLASKHLDNYIKFNRPSGSDRKPSIWTIDHMMLPAICRPHVEVIAGIT